MSKLLIIIMVFIGTLFGQLQHKMNKGRVPLPSVRPQMYVAPCHLQTATHSGFLTHVILATHAWARLGSGRKASAPCSSAPCVKLQPLEPFAMGPWLTTAGHETDLPGRR